MDQKEDLRQEIEQKLIAMNTQLENIKEIMVEATWDGVSEKDVHKAMGAISDLMMKFNYTQG